MTKYKFLMMVSVLLVASLFCLTFVKVSYLQALQKDNKTKELCTLFTGKLKFCTDKQKIIVATKDVATLNFSFINLSMQEIEVNMYDVSAYTFKVTDENGEKIPTKLEQKMRDKVISDKEETGFMGSLVGNHRLKLLQPNEICNEKISLGNIYDFTKVGKYYVEVKRRTMNPNGEGFIETTLGKIEIEVTDNIDEKDSDN